MNFKLLNFFVVDIFVIIPLTGINDPAIWLEGLQANTFKDKIREEKIVTVLSNVMSIPVFYISNR